MDTVHVPRKVLVTGGAGFIGVNFIREVLGVHVGIEIVNLDVLTYAGGRVNLEGIDQAFPGRHTLVEGDIRDRKTVSNVFATHEPDTVFNFAAESHVDRSIDNPLEFIETNVLGTAVLLNEAERAWRGRSDVRFHHISTDEVYGSLGAEGAFSESSPYDPSSPYSASKASSDHLVRAWHRTFGLPVTITNCSNNYGPWQFPEKLIPLMITNAIAGKPLPVYGKGANVRDWLHVEDHCRAVWDVATRGRPGATYNVGGNNEWSNLELVRFLCSRLDALRPKTDGSYSDLITFVEDRPGHDGRYAVNSSRLRLELGWEPVKGFEEGMDETIAWYLEHREWVSRIRENKYDGRRLGLKE